MATTMPTTFHSVCLSACLSVTCSYETNNTFFPACDVDAEEGVETEW